MSTGAEQAALGGATQVCLRKEVQLFAGKRDQPEPRVLVSVKSLLHTHVMQINDVGVNNIKVPHIVT